MSPSPASTERPSFWEKLAYALGDTGTALAWRPLMTFLPIFYTDTVGIPGAAVATLLLVARVSDGFTDVAMGTIADRTQTRWGRYRPWILWSAVPFGLLLALAFTSPGLGDTGNLVWAYVTYILLTLAFTASNVPYSSLTGVITGHVRERTVVSSFRFFGAFAGGALALGLAERLVTYFGQGDDARGYTITFSIYGAMLAAFLLITFFGTRERVQPQITKTRLLDDLHDLLRNHAWLILLLVGFLWVTYVAIRQGVIMYYFTHYMERRDLVGPYMTALVLASLAATVVTPVLARWMGQRTLFLGAMAVSGAAAAATYLAGPDNLPLIFTLGIVSDFAAGAFPVLFFSMLGDAADYSEYKFGHRATGLVYSSGTFAIKLGSGIAGAVMLYVLGRYGYSGTEEVKSATALEGIRLVMSVVPTAFIVACAAVLISYPLTRRRMEEIQHALEERRREVTLRKDLP
ncbi:MAG: MFS transporter [Verrucomicrobiota bacterium JB022]|nr:MFS transporter [Verrucomicrobiota bacterium JB022]